MTKTLNTFFAILICIASQACANNSATTNKPSTHLPKPELVPGGIALLTIPNYTKGMVVNYNNRRAAVLAYKDTWVALGGIPLSAKAGEDHSFSIKYENGLTLNTKITVNAKTFPEQRLTIKNKRKVNPNTEDLKRISAESVRKKKAKAHWSDSNPEFDFIWPVIGRTSSTFGLRRFFNEQERKPHSGLDIAAAEGTPIKATANGTVIESGDFFFSGNMIYLDHGQGIISLYAHLNEIHVKPGDIIQQGDIIGTVGQTGRVTGAHLHFAILANKTLIDPLYMLSAKNNTQ